MTEVKPVAWTQPSQLECIAEGIDHDCRIWAKRDMKEAREWWLLAGIENGPDDVALYAESDFIAMKERAEKAEAEIEALHAQNEWLKNRIAFLQLPAYRANEREQWLSELGMPSAAAEDDT